MKTKENRGFGCKILPVVAAVFLLLSGCVEQFSDAMQTNSGQQNDGPAGGEHLNQSPPPELITFHNYAGLSELITMVCDDAGREFNNFYGPTVVWVKPFVFVGEAGQKKMTTLGVTMADQMIAMINNNSVNAGINGSYPQDLKGVLQEIDGYLRIHISGVNLQAKRRSYSVNVEMSEAVYRALHSNIGG